VSAQSQIPIQNIYYLFCYAWSRFDEAKSIGVGSEPSPDLPNLLAKVLLSGMRRLLRRGLDRSYSPLTDELATVRGRIDFDGTLSLQARRAARLVCEFDELSHDVLHNQIIKAALRRLAQVETLDGGLAHELRVLARRLPGISDIKLRRSLFRRVQLHRNNAHYDLLLKVCELAFLSMLPRSGGGYAFDDVLRDEVKMRAVFEEFVRNFYRLEQSCYSVSRLIIPWDGKLVQGDGRLPLMKTDIFLDSPDRRLIIDTKYYAQALQVSYGSESFDSSNLYQLFAYLKNATSLGPAYDGVEGLLLYPLVGQSLDATVNLQGHTLRLATIDLMQPWPQIERSLLSLVGLAARPLKTAA
jgi:5-methylcytosine-specific restriction enzyme subunit McrC